MPKARSILRLKITLKHTKPPIWRRLEIPSSATFWDLHVAIQNAMGWFDCHLHEFETTDRQGDVRRVGIPDDSGWGEPTLPGWKRKLSPIFRTKGDKATYIYDFGDGWEHTVALEAIEPAHPETTYPRCTGGRRRCPLEDCGGPGGYERLLAILADPAHEEHSGMLEWTGGPIDPDAFAPDLVVFDDPEDRLRFVLQ